MREISLQSVITHANDACLLSFKVLNDAKFACASFYGSTLGNQAWQHSQMAKKRNFRRFGGIFYITLLAVSHVVQPCFSRIRYVNPSIYNNNDI